MLLTRTTATNASLLPPSSPSSLPQVLRFISPLLKTFDFQSHYAAAVVSCGRPVIPGS